MKPQEIKKRYFVPIEGKRFQCLYCESIYKENVTRMALHFSKCKKKPFSIASNKKKITTNNRVS